jgi:hypothetical protein
VNERLPTHVEAAGLVRRVSAGGGFAAVIRKGDPERGALLLLIASRGRHVACLERVLPPHASYRWNAVAPTDSASSVDVAEFVRRRARFDEDMWAIELDIAEPERFIAETTAAG